MNSLSDVDISNLHLLQKQTDKGTQTVNQFEKLKIKGQNYCRVVGSLKNVPAKLDNCTNIIKFIILSSNISIFDFSFN